MPRPLTAEDLRAVEAAVGYLENPKLLLRMADAVGKPVESLLGRLPASAQARLVQAVDAAMHKALELAISSLDAASGLSAGTHTAGAAALGAASGFFGLAGMAVELPLSTAVMLRSIAAIAQSEGADLHDPAVRLECLTVLAMGGRMPTPIDAAADGEPLFGRVGASESAYWAARVGLAVALQQAAAHVASAGAARLTASDLARGGGAVVGKLLAKVAARFQIVVSEKAVAQSVPVAGAVAGAALNAAFADHFNQVARHHFALRRIERHCGTAAVQRAYGEALQALRAKSGTA